MKLVALRVEGFGSLVDRSFTFAPGLTIVVGPNEAGKSTLASAIVASLYGLGRRRDDWRPWSGRAFGATLTYELADGSRYEIVRDFERDPRATRVFDRAGKDVTADVTDGKIVSPGSVHLRLPYDVFVSAACALQQEIAIDGDRVPRITATLAQALDGGPREDAALGALARLDAGVRKHVGTERATKNAPLRALVERAETQAAQADRARESLQRLGDLRARLDDARTERDRLAALHAEGLRRARSRRAAILRARLSDLSAVRDEIAALQESRSRYDDVATFDGDAVTMLEERFDAWRASEATAQACEAEVAASALSEAAIAERDARRADAGTIDEAAFAALEAAAGDASSATARLAEALNTATLARHESESGEAFDGAGIASTAFFALAAIAAAIAHWWGWAATLAVIAFVAGFVTARALGARRARRGLAAEAQRRADEASTAEQLAAATVARVLDPLGLPNVEELRRRRERWRELEERTAAWERNDERAEGARKTAAAAAVAFDTLARTLIGSSFGTRAEARDRARHLAARRRERDGIGASLQMVQIRRRDILGDDDEHALGTELEALLAGGADPDTGDETPWRTIEDERIELEARLRRAELAVTGLAGELRAAEAHVPDLAALDEATAQTRAEIARLREFHRAVTLAHNVISTRTREAHEKFARRLEDYALPHLDSITGGRYREIKVDHEDLTVRVRAPSTGAIIELDRLSAGTREQVYLIVRFAMTRMLAEGLETPPLLLDDPFATWDAARIERCLPILVEGAATTQAIVFTSSDELARAAERAGAQRIELGEAALV